MTKNKPLKKLSKTPQDTKNPKPLWGKREQTPPPAEISCGADNCGAEVRKNLLANAYKQI